MTMWDATEMQALEMNQLSWDPCKWQGPDCTLASQMDESEEPVKFGASNNNHNGLLPQSIVVPVMLAAIGWKIMIISLIGTGLQLFFWVYMAIDWIWDMVVRFLIGSWC